MSLALSEPELLPVPVVLGYVHGSDFTISNELVVLFASYDGLGIDPDGTVYPAANHNAQPARALLRTTSTYRSPTLA